MPIVVCPQRDGHSGKFTNVLCCLDTAEFGVAELLLVAKGLSRGFQCLLRRPPAPFLCLRPDSLGYVLLAGDTIHQSSWQETHPSTSLLIEDW